MELPRNFGGGMNKRIKILIFAVCIVLALGITLYPLISNVVGEKYRTQRRKRLSCTTEPYRAEPKTHSPVKRWRKLRKATGVF